MMELYIDGEIRKVCPIDGISFGDIEDRQTWTIHFTDDATPEQKKAACECLDKIEWNENTQEAYRKCTRDRDYCDKLLYCNEYLQYKANNPALTFSEFLDYLERMRDQVKGNIS